MIISPADLTHLDRPVRVIGSRVIQVTEHDSYTAPVRTVAVEGRGVEVARTEAAQLIAAGYLVTIVTDCLTLQELADESELSPAEVLAVLSGNDPDACATCGRWNDPWGDHRREGCTGEVSATNEQLFWLALADA